MPMPCTNRNVNSAGRPVSLVTTGYPPASTFRTSILPVWLTCLPQAMSTNSLILALMPSKWRLSSSEAQGTSLAATAL
jgi:hypothetical protein